MNDEKPLYLQIMTLIEDDIVSEIYKTDQLIISTTQIAKLYSINPTTANKAIKKLTEKGLIYKKAGIGMCVSKNAHETIKNNRKDVFMNQSLKKIAQEANMLEIDINQIINSLKEFMDNDY